MHAFLFGVCDFSYVKHHFDYVVDKNMWTWKLQVSYVSVISTGKLNFCLLVFINTVEGNTLGSGKNSILTFRMMYEMDIIPNCQQQIPTGRWETYCMGNGVQLEYPGMQKKAKNRSIGETLTINSLVTEPLSFKHQSIDLWCKSMDWFLYDIDHRHERVKWMRSCTLKQKILIKNAEVYTKRYEIYTMERFGEILNG